MNPKVAAFNAEQRRAAQPRALEVIRRREAGETWQAIGTLMGVSRQCVQQLAKAHGYTGNYRAQKAKQRQKVKALYATGKSMAEVGARLGISEGRVWQIVRDYQK